MEIGYLRIGNPRVLVGRVPEEWDDMASFGPGTRELEPKHGSCPGLDSGVEELLIGKFSPICRSFLRVVDIPEPDIEPLQDRANLYRVQTLRRAARISSLQPS